MFIGAHEKNPREADNHAWSSIDLNAQDNVSSLAAILSYARVYIFNTLEDEHSAHTSDNK
jgi:hypothetical protein